MWERGTSTALFCSLSRLKELLTAPLPPLQLRSSTAAKILRTIQVILYVRKYKVTKALSCSTRYKSSWLTQQQIWATMFGFLVSVVLMSVTTSMAAVPSDMDPQRSNSQKNGNLTDLTLVSVRWNHVESPYLVVVWIFVAGVVKVSGM